MQIIFLFLNYRYFIFFQDHDRNIKGREKERLSSFVWICTSTHTESRASVIDANNPGDILETFRVSKSPVLCIASVSGE